MSPRALLLTTAALMLAACSSGASSTSSTSPVATSETTGAAPSSGAGASTPGTPAADAPSTAGPRTSSTGTPLPGTPFRVTPVATLDRPWALAFLPDGRALVTQKGGQLLLVRVDGATTRVGGTPDVLDEGQGGLGDVVLGPDFTKDRIVYLSWAEAADGGSRAAVGRARLVLEGTPRLDGLEVVWRQDRVMGGGKHYGHRLAVAPDGSSLVVSSGERFAQEPAQEAGTNLGRIVRMRLDGSGAQEWSRGHRNPLGLAFDAEGRLWESEMGPRGGDELNLVAQGGNYGWPRASNGSHYDGRDIPDHRSGDGFVAPKVWWTPSVSPGSLMIYSGTRFAGWRGDAFLGALSGQALIRVDLDGTDAAKAEQWDLGARIRAVQQSPDGAIWLLEDGEGGRLLRLDPA